MENLKLLKKGTAITLIALSLALSTCISIFCSVMAVDNAVDRSIDTMLNNADNSVKEFTNSAAYNNFVFSDSLYSKANVVAISADDKASSEYLSALARNLYLNSFAVTDADGKITVAYPESLKGTSMLDNKDMTQFKSNLKGNKLKSLSTAVPVESENGKYTIKACVARSEGGVVIVDATVDNYYLVSGENIADTCKGSTIIAKGGNVVSTNIASADKKTLSDLGIDEGKLNGRFGVKIGDKQYMLKSNSLNGYTVISGVESSQLGIDYASSVVIPIVANAIIFALFSAVVLIFARRIKK